MLTRRLTRAICAAAFALALAVGTVLHPHEQGAFAAGAPHRTSAIVNGGIAGTGNNFRAIGQKFKAGQFRPIPGL